MPGSAASRSRSVPGALPRHAPAREGVGAGASGHPADAVAGGEERDEDGGRLGRSLRGGDDLADVVEQDDAAAPAGKGRDKEEAEIDARH